MGDYDPEDQAPLEELALIVEDAINDWASLSGFLPNGFVGYVEYIDPDGDRCYAVVIPEHQSATLTYGQVEMLKRAVRDDWSRADLD